MRKASRCLSVAAACVVLAACGSDSTAGTPDGSDGAAGAAAPFILDGLPDDFAPVAAGEGSREQDWGTDWGSDSPFVVIGNGEHRVTIAATGYQYEGEATGPYPPPGTQPEPGQWYSNGRTVDDDIALRASSLDVDTTELDRLLDAASPEGRRSAPSVADLPEGWEVLGGSDADLAMSIGQAPGPSGAFGAMWLRGDRDALDAPALSAVSLPGHVADVEAWVGELDNPVSWLGDAHGEALTMEGRPAAFVRVDEREGGPYHVLMTHRSDGSLLVLTSSGSELLSREQLVDLAASARPATDQEWEELGWSTWGGPDLHPDEGDVELARGVVDGTEWLLQATRTPDPTNTQLDDPEAEWHIDPCLKLKGGTRVCATEGSGAVRISSPTESELPTFYVVDTTLPGAAIRVTTRNGSASGALHDLPDGSRRVAVVFGDTPAGFPGCSQLSIPPEFEEHPTFEVTSVDVVDANGELLGCPATMFSPP